MRMWAVIVVVAVVAWTAARLQSEPRVEAPVVAPVARAVEAPPTFEPDIPRVQHVAFAGASNPSSKRNLFSYVVSPVKAEPVVEGSGDAGRGHHAYPGSGKLDGQGSPSRRRQICATAAPSEPSA